MEAAGLAVGVAALFSACIQVFDIVLSAKDCSREYEELSALLALLRLRFELWGNGVGIISGSIGDDDQIIPYNTNLDKPRVRPVIHRALENIHNLLQDVAAVDGRYGLTVTTSDEGQTTLRGFRIFQPRFDKLKDRIRKGQKEKSISNVTRWALHDGKKFEEVIHRLEKFIENLRKVTTELGLYQIHLDELRIRAEIKSLNNEEDLEILVQATSNHSSSSIHRTISDAASQRLSAVTTSIFGEARTQPRSTASTSFHTAKTRPSESILDTVEEFDDEPSIYAQASSTRSCAECAEKREPCTVGDRLVVCVRCNILQRQCSFDIVNGLGTTLVDSNLQSLSLASTPQLERLFAESTSRSRAVPLALNFEAGDKHHGDQISAIQDVDLDYWIGHVDKLALQAHQSTSTAKRMWYELRMINKANVPFISATPISHNLGRILASIEGPPNTPYEGGVFWIVVLASTKIPPEAPTIRFHTKVYHPNIDHRTGKLCADYQQKWHQSKISDSMKGRVSENSVLWSQRTSQDQWTLLSLLIAICALLASPNARDPLIPEIAQKYVEDPKGYHEAARMWTKRYASSLEKPDIGLLFPEESAVSPLEHIHTPSPVEAIKNITSTAAENLPYLRWKYDDRYISNAILCVLKLLLLPIGIECSHDSGTDTDALQGVSQTLTTRASRNVNTLDIGKAVDHFLLRDAKQEQLRQMTGDSLSDLEQWRLLRKIRLELEKFLYTSSTGSIDLVSKPMLLKFSEIKHLIKESVNRLTDSTDQGKYFKSLRVSFNDDMDPLRSPGTKDSGTKSADFDSKYPSYTAHVQDSTQPMSRRPSVTPIPHSGGQPSASKNPVPKLKATDEDARKHHIPKGYSLKNWDPSEEPLILLGSVFDANSLGKWIYDWAAYHHGPSTPITDMAGELWLLLIQLAGKIKIAEEAMPRIREAEDREMIEDFIESGERLTNKFQRLLNNCETPMLKAKRRGDNSIRLGENAGIGFIDSLFGRDEQLEKTEKLMSSLRLWSLRFDANCEEIIRRPAASYLTGWEEPSITGKDLASSEWASVTSTPNIEIIPSPAEDWDNFAKNPAPVAPSSEPVSEKDNTESGPYDDIEFAPVPIRTAFGLECINEETRESSHTIPARYQSGYKYTTSADTNYHASSSRYSYSTSYYQPSRYTTGRQFTSTRPKRYSSSQHYTSAKRASYSSASEERWTADDSDFMGVINTFRAPDAMKISPYSRDAHSAGDRNVTTWK